MDQRVWSWVNHQRLFSNWNRAKCVCSARGTWIIFVDSDDELMNRTAEIDFKAHQNTGADMIEHKMLQVLSSGKICRFEWREAPFQKGDNKTLTVAMRKGMMNWTLPRKMIERCLYQQALAFLGMETCRLRIIVAEDKLHATALYRFVRKFVTVNYFGYLYYKNVPDNSQTRQIEFPSMQSIVASLIKSINARPIPNYVNAEAVFNFCLGVVV
jgi:hypothetical protein